METIQPLTQWVQEALNLEIQKQQQHEAKHASATSGELNMCEATFPLQHISAQNSAKHWNKFTFTFMVSVACDKTTTCK
jgi:hypothetical protein